MNQAVFSRLPRLTHLVFCHPWMMLPAFHRETLVPQLLAAREQQASLAGRVRGMDESPGRRGELAYNEKLCAGVGDRWLITEKNRRASIPYNMDSSRIGQINVNGILGKGLESWDMMCGGVCVDQIQLAMEHLAELRPRALALHFNTPGGMITGIPETADFIRQWSRDVAPVYAYTDTVCASAGLYLAYAADSFTAAASAEIGSIGVYCAVIDSARYYQKLGIDVSLLASGWAKGQGYPGAPVSEQYMDSIAEDVARHAARFFEHVMLARGRQIGQEAALVAGGSPDQWAAEIMQGQSWAAQDAPACLLDGIYPNRRAHLCAILEAVA